LKAPPPRAIMRVLKLPGLRANLGVHEGKTDVKVTAERLPASQVRLEIVSDREEFDAAMEKATRRVANSVTVPGFRRGKAPRALVVRHVGRPAIVTEANGDLMDDLYRRALEQEELMPVTRPEVEVLESEPLSFRVAVEVTPTVDVSGYENARVEPEHYEVTDADVDAYLDQMREERSPWVDPPTPRPVREGDEVVVDIAAFDGDEPFDEPTTGATFVLGRDNLLPQIRDLILGATVGEPVERTITFPDTNPEPEPVAEGEGTVEAGIQDGDALPDNTPDDAPEADPEKPIAEGEGTVEEGIQDGDSLDADAPDDGDEERRIPDSLLGKTLNYRVTVQSVKEREELPLDDELAAALGNPSSQTLAALRADVYRNLHRQRETEARIGLINRIMEQLRDTAKVEIGPALIQQQTEEDAARQLQQIGGMGIDVRQIFGNNSEMLANFLERIRPESETRLTNTLIAREIADKEQVEITSEDIHEEVHRLGMSHDVLEDERSVEMIDADLRERRLFDRLIAIATEGRGLIDNSPESQYAQPELEATDAHTHDAEPEAATAHDETPDDAQGDLLAIVSGAAPEAPIAGEPAATDATPATGGEGSSGNSDGDAESLNQAEAEAEDPATETAVRAGEHPTVAEPEGAGTMGAEHEATPATEPTPTPRDTPSAS